ncbi:hypothetical protein D3C86_1456570 [compost metagenome]
MRDVSKVEMNRSCAFHVQFDFYFGVVHHRKSFSRVDFLFNGVDFTNNGFNFRIQLRFAGVDLGQFRVEESRSFFQFGNFHGLLLAAQAVVL